MVFCDGQKMFRQNIVSDPDRQEKTTGRADPPPVYAARRLSERIWIPR
jgi:hypothetical protein